jgi:hypothetical protein
LSVDAAKAEGSDTTDPVVRAMHGPLLSLGVSACPTSLVIAAVQVVTPRNDLRRPNYDKL